MSHQAYRVGLVVGSVRVIIDEMVEETSGVSISNSSVR